MQLISICHRKLLSILLFTPMMCFCAGNASSVMSLEGILVFTNGGGKIKKAFFREGGGGLSIAYEASKGTRAIKSITKLSDTALLFDECSGASQCTIYQLNIDSRKSQRVRTGIFPQYIPEHDKLFFYDKALDDKNWLFVASLPALNEIKRLAKEPPAKTLPNGIQQSRTMPVVQISKDEVVFLNGDGQLTNYDLQNSKVSSLEVDYCRPIFWRTPTQQLFCTNENAKKPFFLDPRTQNKEDVSVLDGAYGFVYMEDLDSVAYGRSRPLLPFGEAYDIFVYSFREQKEAKLKENSHIAAGIWLPTK